MKKYIKLFICICFALLLTLAFTTISYASSGYIWLEAESFVIPEGSVFKVADNSNASDGKFVYASGNNSEVTISRDFYVKEAGEYDLKILCLENAKRLSPTYWSLDNDSFLLCSQAESELVYEVSGEFSYSKQKMQWYEMGTVFLSEGTHTINIQTKNRQLGDMTIFAFDAIAVMPSQLSWTPDGINKPTAYKVKSFNIDGGIVPGETITATASVTDTSGFNEQMMLALAFYKDNRLVKINTDIKGCGDDPEYCAQITVPQDIDNAVVKAFLFDSSLSGSSQILKLDSEIIDFIINIDEDRDPVILHISDPQIIDADQQRYSERLGGLATYYGGLEKIEQNCFQYIKETVEATNPDLILITGDIVYGEFDDNGTALTEFIRLMETLNIPWAPIFGNHDNESKMGADWQCEQFENAENCLFKQRTLTGNGNYSIGIKQKGKLNRVIFMLDSNGCGGLSSESYSNGHSTTTTGFGGDQIEWYTNVANNIRAYNKDLKFTFAFHIQPKMFATAYEKYGYSGGVPINIDYHKNKAEGDFGYIGAVLKGAWDSSDDVTNGMISLGADSILVGHEHSNSASVVYDGVRYQYGQKCSVYDRNNYVASDGTIVTASYGDAGDPIMGGTVMKLSKTDGTITDAYIYYCDTSDDDGAGGGVYNPNQQPENPEESNSVAGLGFDDGSISKQSGISMVVESVAGENAYKFTANSQGKVYINTKLLKNKSSLSFDVYVPSTSTAVLAGVGDFSLRVKPDNLGGYVSFYNSQHYTFDKWSTITVDISHFNSSCTECALLIAKSNVMYVKNIEIK